MIQLKTARLFGYVLVATLLGACAGGGGSGGARPVISPPPPPAPPVVPPPAPPPPTGLIPDPGSAEYRANWGVAGTNAIVAWESGATGEGVVVGVVDDGIHPDHPELIGRISPLSTDIVAGRNALVTDQSHGSELASLIAGNFNGGQTVGVAFEATILAVRADSSSGGFSGADLADAIDYARENGVDVINLSLGSAAPSSLDFRNAIARATADGIIFTVSAGNNGQAAGDVNYPGRYAADPSVSHGLILVGGGLNSDGTLNPVSNPPGTARDYYLTAPGWEIIVPDYGPTGPVPGFQVCASPGLCQIQGTSYAAPHIAGAVALVMSGFPGLTPAQVVDLLLTTADDVGAPGTDSVNGRGRLNIGRAFEPVGPLAAPLAAGVQIAAGTPLGSAGAAFGDGLSNGSGEWSAAGFDQYGRAFTMDLGANWRRAAPGPGSLAAAPLLWRTARSASGVVYGFAPAEDIAPESYRLPLAREDLERAPVRIDAELAPGFDLAFAAHGVEARERPMAGEAVGHFGFVQTDTSVRVSHRVTSFASLSFVSESGGAHVGVAERLTQRSAEAAQATFDFAPVSLGLVYGRVREEEGLLGLAWAEALGRTPASETHFGGVSASARLSPLWRLNASAEFGAADMAPGAWLAVEEPLRTTAFSAEALAALGPGELSLAVAQPLRVESGALSVLLPQATAYGLQSLTYARSRIDPTPSGRELRLSAGYRIIEGDWFSAFGEAIYVIEPGHVASADPDAVFRFGLRLSR